MIRVLVLTALLLPVFLPAHPHVFVNSNVDFIFARKRLSHLEVQWRFDAMFTSQVLLACDANKDRRISGAEVSVVRTRFFKNLKNFNYFLALWVNEVYLRQHAISSFTAFIARDGHLNYRFRVPVTVPSGGAVTIKVMNNDTSFFVAFMSRAGTSRIRGLRPSGAKVLNNAKVQFQLSYGVQ